MRQVNIITEKALRAAALFWATRFKETGKELFKIQSEEAQDELRKHGKMVASNAPPVTIQQCPAHENKQPCTRAVDHNGPHHFGEHWLR